MKRIKEKWATSGLPPSERIEILNLLLELGRWLRANPPFVCFQSRGDMYRYLNDRVAGEGPIDYLEFGVYRGDAFRLWMELNRHPDSRFYGFDTFEGLPEDWSFFTEVIPRGTWSTGGRAPDIRDPRATFFRGLFQDTLPGFLCTFAPRSPLIINCDADLYSSTLYVLATLNPLLVAGGCVIFDEFSTVHEFRAFRDFVCSFRRRYKVLAAADRFCERLAVEML